MTKKMVAIYPGSFDPITFGHVDIINRALKICDELIVAVAQNSDKNSTFTPSQKVAMINSELEKINQNNPGKKARADYFNGLLVDFAQKNNSQIIIRGLRAVSDFEYEFQMAGMNANLNKEIQTIFLPASEDHHFIASKLVKEVARLGGDVSGFVSPNIARELMKKFSQ